MSYHPHRKADARRQHTTNTISQHPHYFNQKKLKKALYTLYFLMNVSKEPSLLTHLKELPAGSSFVIVG